MARLETHLTTRAPTPKNELVAKPRPKPREKVHILLDVSGSMSSIMDNAKMRIHNATDAVCAILSVSDPSLTAYGYYTFSDGGRCISPLTTEYIGLQVLRPQPENSTMMNLGIAKALDGPPDRIILLSDGEPTCTEDDIWIVVETAKLLGTKIDTIGIGSSNDDLLREIAKRTGGVFQRAEDAKQLVASFRALETRARLLLETL